MEHLSVVNSVDPSAEDNLEKQSGSGKDTIEYCGDYEAFIPTYEISRTSLSRLTNVMPHAKVSFLKFLNFFENLIHKIF